jgi:hypothetical protein
VRHRHIGTLVLGGLAATGLVATGSAGTAGASTVAPVTVAASTATPPHGTISTIAGGPGGPAAATSVSIDPCAIKYGGGALYVGTGGSPIQAVYRLSQRTGVLTPVAGSGVSDAYQVSEPGNGISASAFTFMSPCGVAVDGAGNVLVADSHRVLAVAAKTGAFYGKRMTAGRVYKLANGFTAGGAVDAQLDAVGNVVIAEGGAIASESNYETHAQVIVRAERSGTFYGQRMVNGKTYVIAGRARGGGLLPPPHFGPARTTSAGATSAGAALATGVRANRVDLGYQIGALRLDAAGNLILADPGGDGNGPVGGGSDVSPRIRVIPLRSGTFYRQAMKAGYVYTIAGGGGKTPNRVPATSAALRSAAGVALDHNGNVLIADSALRVIAVRNGTFYGQRMASGDIYTLPNLPAADTVAVDNVGNVLLGGENHVYLLAEKTGGFYGRQAQAGRIYTVAGNGRIDNSGDGGPATRAELMNPSGVAASKSGTLTAVADDGEYQNAVQVIARKTGRHFGRAMLAGAIYTVGDGDTLNQPNGVAFDRSDNLVIADPGTYRVRVAANSSGVFYGMEMTAGHIYTVAGSGIHGFSGDGGSALAASLGGPLEVAIDLNGNVLLIDDVWDFASSTTDRIRIVAESSGTFYGQHMTKGDIYTVAGVGQPGYSGDGGPATAAEILPQGIAVDASGNLVIADSQRIRVVAAKTGTFYGRAMTVGYIYTVAGGGTRTGDGTPALSASLIAAAVAVDQAGNLLVGGWNTVWMVAEKPGTYYGKTMRAGDVYTVAHSVVESVLLDGIPAVRGLFSASGLAVQPGTENLLMADILSSRVRSVSR